MKQMAVKMELMRRGIPVVEIANYLNCDPPLMSNYLNGRRRMPDRVKEMIAAYLAMPEDILFHRCEEEYYHYILATEGR